MIKKNPNGFEKVKLEDCFEHFQEKEILSGTNQIYCNQCSQMSNASNGNQLFTLPEVMTIILNRGKGIEFDVNFVYPLRLNVDRFVLDKECKNNDYELIAVLSHIGPSGMAGHFIAICKSPNNRWYIYNDALVNECEDPRNINNDMKDVSEMDNRTKIESYYYSDNPYNEINSISSPNPNNSNNRIKIDNRNNNLNNQQSSNNINRNYSLNTFNSLENRNR